MAINRNPKKNFSQLSNDLVVEYSIEIIGIIYFFLRKPPGWHMKISDLLENWSGSEKSLRRHLKELRIKDCVEKKSNYDSKKKRFAGSYYILKETNKVKEQGKDIPNPKNPSTKPPEQTYPKNRGSANTESLQNDRGHNNTDITNNNTDIKYIDSNTIEADQEFEDWDEIEGGTDNITYGREEYHRLIKEGFGKSEPGDSTF
jgi:hypothetical protein